MIIEIVQAELERLDSARLWGRHIDFPKTGSRVEAHALTVIGWALGRSSPAVAVELVHEDAVIGRAPIAARRPDLAATFPHVPEAEQGGFRATLGVLSAADVELRVQAVLRDQSRVPLALIRARRGWRDPDRPADGAPLVSVIIPCYNQAHFLAEAIESVLAQSYPHLELVVVDDGSSDNTQEVAARYPGVRCVRQENRGLAGARNTGLRRSNGRYLVFLDADDRLLPSALDAGLAALSRSPACAFAYGCYRSIDLNGSPLEQPAPQIEADPYTALLRGCFIGAPAAVMYRRELFESVGGFDTELGACEDYDLYLRTARDFPICGHDEVVAEYRVHAASMSQDPELMLCSAVRVLRSQKKHARRRGGSSRAAYKAGMKAWQQAYGVQLVEQLCANGSGVGEQTGSIHRTRALGSLLRYHPKGLFDLARAKVRPLVAPNDASRVVRASPAQAAAQNRAPETRMHVSERRQREDHTTGSPRVSVIIPFLDAGRFLCEAIESVLDQTFEDWELLLVDDGSSDGSTQVALQYALDHPARIRFLEHEGHRNRGACASRNLGIANARGEYVALLDDDDVWLPHKLERQLEIMESHPEAAMVYGRSQYWRSWTEKPEDAERDFVPEIGLQHNTVISPPELFAASYPFGEAWTPCPSSFLFRREMTRRLGGFEEEFQGVYQLFEDQAFLTKVYLSEPVFVSDETWVRYRLHPDSCGSVVMGAGRHDSVRSFYLRWLKGYLTAQGMEHTNAWKVLQSGDEASPKQDGKHSPSVGEVQFGHLRQLRPIGGNWGYDRGLPIDRAYIEAFLARHAGDIRGSVLEIGDDAYTRRFGGARVTKTDVLHVTEGNPKATIVADLARADHVPSAVFDCVILTQTLHLIYDVRAALRTLHRILKPNGVLLATFPGITRISRTEWAGSWFWGFTTHSARRLFEEVFRAGNITVSSYGNVLTAAAFLYGLAVEDLRPEEIEERDPDYEVSITVRAVKEAR